MCNLDDGGEQGRGRNARLVRFLIICGAVFTKPQSNLDQCISCIAVDVTVCCLVHNEFF